MISVHNIRTLRINIEAQCRCLCFRRPWYWNQNLTKNHQMLHPTVYEKYTGHDRHILSEVKPWWLSTSCKNFYTSLPRVSRFSKIFATRKVIHIYDSVNSVLRDRQPIDFLQMTLNNCFCCILGKVCSISLTRTTRLYHSVACIYKRRKTHKL